MTIQISPPTGQLRDCRLANVSILFDELPGVRLIGITVLQLDGDLTVSFPATKRQVSGRTVPFFFLRGDAEAIDALRAAVLDAYEAWADAQDAALETHEKSSKTA